jgi:hypothetical protein
VASRKKTFFYFIFSVWFLPSMVFFFFAVGFFSSLSVLVSSGISSSYLHGIPQNQYNALQAFYNATNGPYWRWDSALTKMNYTVWNFTQLANPCADKWQGVFCECTTPTQNRCTVVQISLARYNLSGTIPSSFDALTDLVELTLEKNYITDPFPDSFQHLQNLSILGMKFNPMKKFPEILSLCKSLTYIDLSYNLMSNTIPSSISQLSSLSKLYLNNNFMNGTLPLGLWNLTQLQDLHLFYNLFTGTISSNVSQLTNLRRFLVEGNSFFGSIPDLFPVSKLDVFQVENNLFSKTIPANFQNAHFLEDLYLYSNSFSGTFQLGNKIPNLVNIQINHNFFHGNLTYLQDFNEMAFLVVSENMFTNTLPFSRWRVLLVYEASNNYFTGPFPSLFSNITYLEEFDIGSNFVSGRLPTSTTLFGFLLTGFNISNNLLSGRIPVIGSNNKRIAEDYSGNYSIRFNLTLFEYIRSKRNVTFTQFDTSLQTLMANDNRFTGPLPGVICLFSQLSLISFSNNQLTGPIPSNYSFLNFANQFTVGNNKLNGPIGSVFSIFNSSKLLNVLDLSENQFTGSIPDGTATDFYDTNSNSLQVVNLGINCLSGTLPDDLCKLNSLRTLILDGLTSSPSCVLHLIDGLSTFIHKNKFSGSIPSCLLGLPGLQTFHSSGNGIKGNFPQSLNVSNSLNDLVLSHNELTGSIPLSIQQKENWLTLDLSYNRLSGTLSPLFYPFPNNNDNSSDLTLSLEINHLSGNVPSSLLTGSSLSATSSLSILEGNIFNCGNDKAKNLPNNDRHYQNYDCASSTAEIVILLSSLLCGLCILLIFTVLLPWRNIITVKLQGFVLQINNWKDTFSYTNASIESSSSFYFLKDYLANLVKLLLLMMCFSMIIAQPTWIGISKVFGTYEFQYVWLVSAIFTSGQSAAIVLLIIFLLWFSLFFYAIETMFTIPSHSSETVTENQLITTAYELINPRLPYYVYSLVVIADAFIMFGIDVVFVVCTLNLPSSTLIVILLIIAVLRVLINNVLVWKLVPVFSKFVEKIYLRSTRQTTLVTFRKNSTEQEKEPEPEGNINNISNEEGKIEQDEEMEETKTIHLARFLNEEFLIGKILILNNILYPVLAVIIILPDCFYYAFVQPSTVTSTFSYLSCTVYSFTVCIPSSIEVVTETTSFIPPFGYTYLCASNIITYYISLFFLSFFFSAIGIPIMKLLLKFAYDRIITEFDETEQKNETSVSHARVKRLSGLQKVVLILVPNRFRHYRPQKENTQIIDLIFCGQRFKFNLKSLPISNWKKFVCQVNGDLTILFSFGIVFPPLMVFGGICLIGIICFEFLTLGKLLYDTRQLNYLWYEKELLNETQDLMDVFRSNMRWTMFISSLLLGLIVFDTWGVEKGWKYGLIGFLVLNMVLLCSFCLYYWFHKQLKQQRRIRSATTVGIEVSVLKEMQDRKTEEDSVTVVENPLCDRI